MKLKTLNNLTFSVVLLAGCSTFKHSEQVEQATQNWNEMRARVKLQLAQRNFDAGAINDALEHCSEVISLDSALADAHLLMARIRLERGEVALAESALALASAIDPETSEVLYLRGYLAERKGRDDEAATFYMQAYESDPGDADILVTCAESLIAADRIQDALDLLIVHADDFDQNPAIYLLMGQVYDLMRRPDQAADAYLKALDLNPGDDLLREAAALALVAAGEEMQALNLIKSSDASDADSLGPGLSRTLARALLKTGRAFNAISLLQRATRANENDISLSLLLAEAYMITDQIELAGPVLNEAVARDPDHLEARLMLAYHALITNQIGPAIATARQIVRQYPNDVQAHAILARALERDPAQAHLAAEHYRHILSLDSAHPWVRQRLESLAQNPDAPFKEE